MKDFTNFGIKRRVFPECNYNAVWYNLKTLRLGTGVATELPADQAEFYDVALGTVCTTGKCPFCYVASNPKGEFYQDISETWRKWMNTFWEKRKDEVVFTNKMYQIAIGSTSEPTEHPEFCDFLKAVYDTNVVPNYTTNGVLIAQDTDLSERILEATRKYVGGVAVSFGNTHLHASAKKAVKKLLDKGNCHVNIHHIISDKKSVDNFLTIQSKYGSEIKYHVLLPLMPAGRSTKGIEDGVFEYLEQKIKEKDIKNIAFGAHFVDYLRNSGIKTWLYEPESFSKNILLKKDKVVITPSSFNLTPIKIINL